MSPQSVFITSNEILNFVKDQLKVFQLEGDATVARCTIQRIDELVPEVFEVTLAEAEKLGSRVAQKYPETLLKKRVARRALLTKFPGVQEKMWTMMR